MEQHEVKVNQLLPTEYEFHWQCPQCKKAITNKDIQWEIRIERWNDHSYEAVVGKKLMLDTQCNLRMCNECYEAIKKYFR